MAAAAAALAAPLTPPPPRGLPLEAEGADGAAAAAAVVAAAAAAAAAVVDGAARATASFLRGAIPAALRLQTFSTWPGLSQKLHFKVSGLTLQSRV